MTPELVAAVITAFRPGRALATVVDAAAAQCGLVVVIDNTPVGEPGADRVLEHRPQLIVERSPRNVGLAAALNRGVTLTGDAAILLLLDQDSAPPADLVTRLARHLTGQVRIATPAPWDATAGRYLDPRTARRAVVADVPVAITSGMVLRRSAVDQVGPFREEFFVDCVDQDFCLRVRRAGGRIVQDRRVLLPHNLGDTRWRGIGPLRLRSTQHPTWRLYWAARNGVVLARENLRREPAWALTSLAFLGYVALTVALFEPPRVARLARMARGIRDGLAGRVEATQRPGGAP